MEKTNASKQGVLHWLDENFEKMFLVTGLLSITLFITWQVIYRYIITQFIERAGAAVWTEELSRYIFIWISYLALSVAIKKRSSIRVDMLYDHLPPRLQQISWIVVEVLFFILTATIAYYGWGQIERLQEYPQHTTALRIPFLIPYLILPFGFGLMCFRLLQSLYKQVKVCGLVDTLIGLIAVFVIASPVIFCDYIEPLPALFGYFIVLCAIGVPVAISLGLSTLATIICADTLPIEYMAQVAFTSIDSFPIMAIPFFIAAGVFMGAGGLSHRLLSLADEIVGGTYGGIGLTAIVTCMFFGAISGSGPATVAAIGRAHHPRDGGARLRQVFFRRPRRGRRLRGRHDPPEQPLCGVRHLRAGLHRRPVHERYRARHHGGHRAYDLLLLVFPQEGVARSGKGPQRTDPHARGLGRQVGAHGSGHRARRHLRRHHDPDRSRGHRRLLRSDRGPVPV